MACTRPVVAVVRIAYAARTDLGLVRLENEDALVLDGCVAQAARAGTSGRATVDDAGAWSASVRDGLGGHRGGSLASAVATTVLADRLRSPQVDDPAATYQAAFVAASNRVAELSAICPDLAHMGATAVVVVAGSRSYAVANVGDARAHRLWRGEYLAVLSVDDRATEGSSLVTQALGRYLPSDPDVHHYRLEVDGPTLLLLSSDGLTDVVQTEVLKEVLAAVSEAPSPGARSVHWSPLRARPGRRRTRQHQGRARGARRGWVGAP